MTYEQCKGCKHLITERLINFINIKGEINPIVEYHGDIYLCALTKLYSGGNGEAVIIDFIKSCANSKQQ